MHYDPAPVPRRWRAAPGQAAGVSAQAAAEQSATPEAGASGGFGMTAQIIPFRPKLRPVEVIAKERELRRIELIRALAAELQEPGHPFGRVPYPASRLPAPIPA
jgi:hypothetical protein